MPPKSRCGWVADFWKLAESGKLDEGEKWGRWSGLLALGHELPFIDLSMPRAQKGCVCQRWRRATMLILDQADVAAVSQQVHLALFYDAQLDLGAMR